MYPCVQRLTSLPPLPSRHSKLASEYDSRFEKTVAQLIEEIQKRRYFISVDWVEDDSEDEDKDETGGDDGQEKKATKAKTDDQPAIRLLDYACGTGLISRVRLSPPSPISPARPPAGTSRTRRPPDGHPPKSRC